MYDTMIGFLMLGTPLVFLLGVVTLMLTRLFTGPAPGDPGPAYVLAIRAAAWMMTALAFVAGTFLVFPGMVITWFTALAVVISMIYSKQAATQQYAMLALVGAAAERSIPLVTVFAAFGRERGGWMRRRSAEIVYMLSNGASLPAALETVPGALPPEAVPLVCVGYENGSLETAVTQAVAAHNLYEPVWQSIVPKIGYVCVLPGLAVGIVGFIVLKIMPQYEKIFKDFGMLLPADHAGGDCGLPIGIPVDHVGQSLAALRGAVCLWLAALRGIDPLGPAGNGRALSAAAYRHRAGRPCRWRPSGNGRWARPC